MPERGGQPGNQNASKGKPWRDAINRALAKRSRVDRMEALDDLAEKFLEQCDAGDIAAFREFGDRLDGKAPQGVTISGDADNPLVNVIRREVIDPQGEAK